MTFESFKLSAKRAMREDLEGERLGNWLRVGARGRDALKSGEASAMEGTARAHAVPSIEASRHGGGA